MSIDDESCKGLKEELQQILSLHFGAERQVRSLRRRRSNYSSSYTIENLEVELDRGNQLRLVFKDLSPNSMLPAARQVRPGFAYNPQREIETYRFVLDSKKFGTPAFYGAVEQPEVQRYWLFLERVEGPLLWQLGRFEQWERTARWLGHFHHQFRRNKGKGRRVPATVLKFDQSYCMRWMERAEQFLSQRCGELPKGMKIQFIRSTRKFDKVVARLLSLPQTLIHGEFYPSNIILGRNGTAKRVCPIDWEGTAIGPGLIDLAALASGNWTDDRKKQLVRAYREALEPPDAWPPSLDEMLELVDCCQLYLAVQWLGWAADWSPPKEHAQDWLREALRLTERLGL